MARMMGPFLGRLWACVCVDTGFWVKGSLSPKAVNPY